MSHRRRRPMARSLKGDRRPSVPKAVLVLALSSIALSAAAPGHAAPLGQASKSPTVRGPFVYPAVKPLVFTGSLASLPIAQPGPSWDLPIGFPRAPQLLPPGGGSVGADVPPAEDGGASHTASPTIDFSNVYPNFNGVFDLCCPGRPERRRRAEPLRPDGEHHLPDLEQGRHLPGQRRTVRDQLALDVQHGPNDNGCDTQNAGYPPV